MLLVLAREPNVANSGFPKKSRLLKAAEYRAVFGGAQFKVSSRYFLILAVCNKNPNPRLGLVVAKKNIPSAVQRNRIRRQIRESFRHRMGRVSDLDLVVLVRRDADKLSNKQLSKETASLLQDLGNKLQDHKDKSSQTH